MPSGQSGIPQLSFRLPAGFLQRDKLPGCAFQAQFLDVVIRITDLVDQSQGNQYVRRKIAVHVGMQVCPEFAVGADIGFHDRLFHAQAVILGLAHQGFGNSRNGCLELHPAIRIDVGDLCVAQAENVHPFIVPVAVAGDFVPDHRQAVFVRTGFQSAQPGQVFDQVAGPVVRGPDHIVQALSLQVQIHRHILFPIKVEFLEENHSVSPFPSGSPGIDPFSFCMNPNPFQPFYHHLTDYGIPQRGFPRRRRFFREDRKAPAHS